MCSKSANRELLGNKLPKEKGEEQNGLAKSTTFDIFKQRIN
jgi:hypothetical protein